MHADDGRHNIHRRQFAESAIVHRAGSHSMVWSFRRLSGIFPNGVFSGLAQKPSMMASPDCVTSCLSAWDICWVPTVLSARLTAGPMAEVQAAHQVQVG